jgi:hypothetical protein
VSTSPIQRIADLEARVTALTAENEGLRARINGHGNGNGPLDIDKLIETVGLRIERSGQLLREDFTGKLAGLISPYIDKTLRQCDEVAAKQDELEKKFKEHKKAVASSAAEIEASFVKIRKEANKDWTAQRDIIQEDLGRVDSFVTSFRSELQRNGKKLNDAVTDCRLSVRACHELAQKMAEPTESAIARLDEVKKRGEADIAAAATRLKNTYNGLREPFMKGIAAVVIAILLLHLGLGVFIMWGNRRTLDQQWDGLVNKTEEQKKEIQGALDGALKQVKEAQIDSEIKAKMWDEIVKDLDPQHRDGYLMKLRERVRKAGDKRLDDQMQAGYDQMNGKKK